MRIAALLLLVPVLAFSPVQEGDDLIFRVMRDEMTRSTARLKLEKSGPPYYVEYAVSESESFQVAGSFGALTGRGGGKSRYCSIDLRVGDARLDNTNFSGSGGGTSLTIDDDYDALRHELWLATDREYKDAVEALEKKKAFLQQNNVQDRPDDLSKEEPVVQVQAPVKLVVDQEKWSAAVRRISAVFKEFPRIQKSSVVFVARAETRWFLNNEGFKNRGGDTSAALLFGAVIQAEDGMKLADAELMAGRTEKDLPTPEAAEQAARDLAKRLEQLAAAPKAEEYTGPILFEGAAGASYFAQALAPQLGSSQEPLGRSGSGGNPWKEKIGQKVTVGFLSITSDPTAKEANGLPIVGGYDIDDDGVRGRKLSLIEKGVLKTFCMSRIPTRHIKQSNGHSRDGIGGPSTLFVESTKKWSAEKLRERLFELGRDEGLTHVLIVRKLAHPYASSLDYQAFQSVMGARGQVMLYPPSQIYRVNIETGQEEMIRGARWGSISLRILRDIEATGDDAKPRLASTRTSDPGMVVAPSVLIREIELNKPGKETEKLPSYPHPLFEGK